jgi:hypothetical protein
MELAGAHALTLKQPWAELVARYGKPVENRVWPPWPGLSTLLIHAGKAWDRRARAYYHGSGQLGDIATSAIVAVAHVDGACNLSRYCETLECGCDPAWAQPGQHHWQLRDVYPLPNPVPASGKQGLWRPDSSVLFEVASQYRPDQIPDPLPLPPLGVMPELPGEVIRSVSRTMPGDCSVCGDQDVPIVDGLVKPHHPVRVRATRDEDGRILPKYVRVLDAQCDGAGLPPQGRGGRPRKAA